MTGADWTMVFFCLYAALLFVFMIWNGIRSSRTWLRIVEQRRHCNDGQWVIFCIWIRLKLLMPFACRWNAWVRDVTAWMERRGR